MKLFKILLEDRKIENCYIITVPEEQIAQEVLEWKFQEPLTEDTYRVIEWACKNAPRY